MRRSVLAAVLTVAGTVAALVPAALAAAPSTSFAASSAGSVRLPTGDAVRVTSGSGAARLAVVPAERHGPAAQFDQTALAGDRYVFPAEARPFLGGVLDPSLFDVTALADASPSGRIPVTLTAAPHSTVHVPGFTATSSTATGATGYLAQSGAAAFRTALLRAWKAAVQPGATAPKTLFGGVTHLARTGAATAAQPDFPQVTLVVNVLDATGHPASGAFVGIVNTDDARKYTAFLFATNGIARASVPVGNYSAITDVSEFDTQTGIFTDRIVPVADFAVTHNLQRVTMDARTATRRPSVQTPRPAGVDSLSVEFDREAAGIGSLGSSFLYDGTSRVFVAPTGPAEVGQLQWVTSWSLSGGDASAPYSYDLSFVNYGSVPADQSATVQPYQLATVQAHYYNARPSDSQFDRVALYPFEFGVFSLFKPLHTPTDRTEYIHGDPTAVWIDSLIASPTSRNPFAGFVDDDLRLYPAGSSRAVDWLRGPLASAPPEPTEGDTGFSCPDCRSNGGMYVLLAPFTDTTPGHFGEVNDLPDGSPATDFALYRDGTQIAGGSDLIGARVHVPSDPATYRLHLAVDRAGDHPRTSTSTVTDLVFRSSAGSGPDLPQDWTCPLEGSCTVLPLLKATVPLPTTLSDRMPIGHNTFEMTVAPFRGAGSATITSATFATSTDGVTFTPADVRRESNDQYQVILDNPASAAGQPITVRVTATDDSGGKLTQTTTAAYLVANS